MMQVRRETIARELPPAVARVARRRVVDSAAAQPVRRAVERAARPARPLPVRRPPGFAARQQCRRIGRGRLPVSRRLWSLAHAQRPRPAQRRR